MLEIKYAGRPFGAMDAQEVIKTAWALLVKLHVITGWNIPADESMQNELVKQFSLKLQESYEAANSEEMEYAFRTNTDVKDWGKAMNLSLIDEVMRPYLNKRFELSRIEEQQKTKLALPPVQNEILDADFIEAVYQSFKITGQMTLIPELAFKILEPTLSLTRERKAEILAAITSGCDPETPMQTKILLCRQLAVAEYFENTYKK